MTTPDETALLERARRGDPAALGQLLRGQQDRVYNVCLRMVSHPDDAAELAQDAMVKAIQKIADFRGDAKLSTWMTRIAMNLAISHLRKRKLRKTASLDSAAGNGAPGSDSDSETATLAARLPETRELSPDHRVEQEEMLDHLQRAIDRLDEDQRAVLVLRDLEQMDYAQIGQVLDLPEGTVKSRLFRARLALRERMNPVANLETT